MSAVTFSFFGAFIKRYESALFFLVCVSLLWLPLPSASARLWSMMIWASFIFAIFFLWGCGFTLGWYQLSKTVQKSWLALVCLGFIPVWIFIQSAAEIGWSLDRSASLYMALLSTAYFVLFFLLLQILTPARCKTLLVLIFIMIVVQAIYAVMMVLTGTEMGFFVVKQYFQGFATGTFVNPNHFAAFLNIGLAIGVASLVVSIKELEGRKNIFSILIKLMASGSLAWRIALVICVIALVMTSSRMGNLAFAVALLSTTFIYMLVKRRIIWVWIWLIASIFLIDALIISARFGVDRLASEVMETVVLEETRASLISMAIPMVQDYFWLGIGAGAFYSVFPMYSEGKLGSTDFYYHLHNDYLEFLIEWGVVGLIPLSVFVFFSLRFAILSMKSKSHWAQVAGFTACMAMAAIAFHSMADFSLRIPAYAATLLVIMAMPYCLVLNLEDKSSGRSRRRRKVKKA